LGLDPAKDGPIERMNDFVYHYDESGIVDWLAGNDVLKSYAGAFAFGAFLCREYGGPALFADMLANDQAGEAAITAALAANGYSETFADAFRRFGEALVFSDKPALSSVKTLKQAGAWTIGDLEYSVIAIDLPAIQQHMLGSGWVSPATYGIRVFDPASTIRALRPFGYSVHSSASWRELSGPVVIDLQAPGDPAVKFYIMAR
jgi:hypothetical protein